MLWRRPRPQALARPCSVYAAYNADGEVIYVGQSVHPERRWCEHECSKPWAPEVAWWAELERFPTVAEAKAKEAQLIRAWCTRWNLDGSPVAAEVAARYVAMFGGVPTTAGRRGRSWPARLLVGLLRALWTLAWTLTTAAVDLVRLVVVHGLVGRRRTRRRSVVWLLAAGVIWLMWTRSTRAS